MKGKSLEVRYYSYTNLSPHLLLVRYMLANLKASDKSTKWTSIENMHQVVYIPILDAFRKELLRLDKENSSIVAENLVQYLIGNEDFYKVIKGNKKVEI